MLYMFNFGITLYRNNFLRLDVYYGELKQQVIEEVIAYDVVSFFSK